MYPTCPTYASDEPAVIDLDAVRAKKLRCDPEAATLDVGDLTTLHVGIAELRVAPDGKWLYVLQVTCGRVRWRVQRRYSEIRGFWQKLRELLAANETTCTERCHFLAGLEGDKFPKKHLLHTKTKLEERAHELETFFVKLTLRLNLCNRVQMERCYLQKCSLLTLLTSFFEVGAQYASAKRGDPYARLTSYQSRPRIENDDPRNAQQQPLRHSTSRIGGSSKTKVDRRFSFGALRDVRVAIEPQS